MCSNLRCTVFTYSGLWCSISVKNVLIRDKQIPLIPMYNREFEPKFLIHSLGVGWYNEHQLLKNRKRKRAYIYYCLWHKSNIVQWRPGCCMLGATVRQKEVLNSLAVSDAEDSRECLKVCTNCTARPFEDGWYGTPVSSGCHIYCFLENIKYLAEHLASSSV